MVNLNLKNSLTANLTTKTTAAKTTLWCCLLLMFFLTKNAYALSEVTASVDKNPAMINESIILTVIADDDINRSALDTSPLLADFIVGQTSVSSQTSMINFKTSRITQWQIVLIARRTGELTIPALTIEKMSSSPISLNILAQSEAAKEDLQQDIFVTSELSNNEVYVQQLVTLTIKLHFSVELKSGSLTEPNLPGANIEKIGQDKQSDAIINGKRYRVIEQTYAITPQESGEFTLPAPVFSGDIMTAAKRRSSFLSFAQTKPVSVLGDELPLKVKASPTKYPSHDAWLPSELISLHQEWQKDGTTFKVGEPITRTITLTAAGLAKEQLPEIIMPATQGLKIYPDQAQLHTNLTKENLVSQKVQNFAIVPSNAGEFTLPEISITWFNTVTNKTQYATLPAQTITVEPGDASTTNQNKPALTAPLQQTQPPTSLVQTSTNVLPKESNLTWLFLALWLFTALAWLVHVRFLKQNNNKVVSTRNTANNNSNHYLALLAACKKNNANQVLNLLLPWLNQHIQDKNIEVSTIAQAQAHINEQHFSTALHDLQQHLYGKSAIVGAPSWQGDTLLASIQKLNLDKKTSSNTKNPLLLNP